MARADYYLCDICGTKCFYDAKLNWDSEAVESDFVRNKHLALDYCGDMAAICKGCAKDNKIVIIPIDS